MPDRTPDRIDEELQSHIDHRADDLERAGLPRAEAVRRARIEFGGYQGVREECREARGGTFAESVMQDLRYAVRLLRRSPAFTLVAVLTLALAIGANAVVFSVMNGLILRPLNVADADRLYEIKRTDTKYPFQSYPDYLDIRDRNRCFDGVAAFNMVQAWVDAGDTPNRVWAYQVTGNYFDLLGVQPRAGRLIHATDEHGPNSAPYVVLSHAYWLDHFRGDPAAIGRTILLNKHPFTVIGVVPPDFHGTVVFFNPDFFVPMVNREQVSGQNDLSDRAKRWVFMTIGRLKAGMTPGQAVADLNLIGTDPESLAMRRFFERGNEQTLRTLAASFAK